MLRIYDDAIELVRLLRPLWDKIKRHDRDLGKQLQRATPSIVSNIAEGCYRRGGHRTERYDTAMGSARECRALLQAAVAAGYLANNECEVPLELIDKIVATLWRCTYGR